MPEEPEVEPEEEEDPEPYSLQSAVASIDDVPTEYQTLYEEGADSVWRARIDDGGSADRARTREREKLDKARTRIVELETSANKPRPKPTDPEELRSTPRRGPPSAELVGARASLTEAKERIAELESENAGLAVSRKRSAVIEMLLPLVRGGKASDGSTLPELYPEAESDFIDAAVTAYSADSNGKVYFQDGDETLTPGAYVSRQARRKAYMYRGVAGSGSPRAQGSNVGQVLARSDLKTNAEKVAYMQKQGRERYENLPLSRD